MILLFPSGGALATLALLSAGILLLAWSLSRVAAGLRQRSRTVIRPRVEACNLDPDLDLGPPVAEGGDLAVLLHGTFCDGRSVEALGCGLAELDISVWRPEFPYLDSLEGNARRLAECVQARLAVTPGAGPARILLVGYSQGALLGRWFLAYGEAYPWVERVEGLIQVAPPNAGLPLARWLAGEELPAFRELTPGSPLLCSLAAKRLPEDLPVGILVGRAPSRELLEYFLGGTGWRALVARLGGALLEASWMGPGEHDGVLPEASARATGGWASGAQVRVEVVPVDHIRLLRAPASVRALVELARVLCPSRDGPDGPSHV